MMMDFAAGCFSDSAVSVAGSSSSGQQPLQKTVSCFYRVTLSTKKVLQIKVTWHKSDSDSFTTVAVGDISLPTPAPSKADVSSSQLLRKCGRRSFFTANSMFVLHWDISAAKYAGAGPEPAKDFYLILMADGELALHLGDKCGDFLKKLSHKAPLAAFAIYGRAEQVLAGAAAYSTRVQFSDGGREHEVSVGCWGDERDERGGELRVSVDRRTVVRVKSVQWNFRGNQTVKVGGAVVDVLWDAHDWWFCEASGGATFAFRARSGAVSESCRLRPDEDLEMGSADFTLVIQVFRSYPP